MMKKRLAALFTALMMLSLPACAETQEEDPDKFQLPTVSTEDTVECRLASMYVTEDLYSFDAASYAQEQDFLSVTYNDIDDTFTLVMSGERYNTLLAQLQENIDYALNQILGDENFSYIKDITYTNNMDQFTLTVDRSGYLATEDFTPEYIESFVGVYRALLELQPQITFTVVDEADGSTLAVMTVPETE